MCSSLLALWEGSEKQDQAMIEEARVQILPGIFEDEGPPSPQDILQI